MGKLYTQLNIEERETIFLMRETGKGVRDIAVKIGRSHSTVIREVARNMHKKAHQYRPSLAQKKALGRRKGKYPQKVVRYPHIKQKIIEGLK